MIVINVQSVQLQNEWEAYTYKLFAEFNHRNWEKLSFLGET